MLFAFCVIPLGRAITANEKNVLGLISFLHKNKQYLGVSGDGNQFEVFDVSNLKAKTLLSEYYKIYIVFLLRPSFFGKLLKLKKGHKLIFFLITFFHN